MAMVGFVSVAVFGAVVCAMSILTIKKVMRKNIIFFIL
jgi:hypothetical protein